MAWSRIIKTPETDAVASSFVTDAYRITEGKTFSVYAKGDIIDQVEILVYLTNFVDPDPSDDSLWTLVDRDFLDADPYFFEGEIDTASHIYVRIDATAGSYLDGYVRIMSK